MCQIFPILFAAFFISACPPAADPPAPEAGPASAEAAVADPLPSWNDGPKSRLSSIS